MHYYQSFYKTKKETKQKQNKICTIISKNLTQIKNNLIKQNY